MSYSAPSVMRPITCERSRGQLRPLTVPALGLLIASCHAGDRHRSTTPNDATGDAPTGDTGRWGDGDAGCDADECVLHYEDGAYRLTMRLASFQANPTGWTAEYRVTLTNGGPAARDVRAELLAFSSQLEVESPILSFGNVAAGQDVSAAEMVRLTATDLDSGDVAQALRWLVSGGVLLSGDAHALARDALPHVSPIPVRAEMIENGMILQHLEADIDPNATVGAVNAALAAIDGRIVTCGPPVLGVVISVPDGSDPATLRQAVTTLESKGGFLHAHLAYTPQPFELPGSGTDAAGRFNADHLFPTRFPAAWNVAGLVDRKPCDKVTVLVADSFTDSHSVMSQLSHLRRDGRNPDRYHGWIVAAVLGGKFDATPPTGAARVDDCIDIYAANMEFYSRYGYGERFHLLVDDLTRQAAMPIG